MNQLRQYFAAKGVDLTAEEIDVKTIIQLYEEKQRTISNLEGQITRYKCEEVKNQKLIKSLQDKITQLAPSNGNTGSNFMMASEFKSNFEEFMTSTVPLALGSFIDRPYLFSQCMETIFLSSYQHAQAKISQVVTSVANIFNIAEDKCEKSQLQNKIKLALMKIFQDYWDSIVPSDAFPEEQFVDSTGQLQQELLDELNENIGSEDCQEMRNQLHKIVVYMLLQEKPWQFVGLNQKQIKSYSKKQFSCLDGWVKEGKPALQVLEGLKKDGHMHANLKNYVIPIEEQDTEKDMYKPLVFQEKKEQEQSVSALTTKKSEMEIQNVPKSATMEETQNNPHEIEESQKKLGFMLMKNKSAEYIKENKQNIPNFLNKKSKKKDKVRASFQNSLNHQKSPKHRKRRQQSLRSKKMQLQDHLQDKFCVLKDQAFAKKKGSTAVVTKNINNSHDIYFEEMSLLPAKRRQVQDFPVSKDLPQRKKTKAPSNRKNSVGKIVHQHQNYMKDVKDKQNSQFYVNAKPKTKEKAYKDIIKQKLLIDDKYIDKMPLCSAVASHKSKTDRRKDESRPLKLQGNASKLRQKYIN